MLNDVQQKDPLLREAASIWEEEGLGALASECGLLDPPQPRQENAAMELYSQIMSRAHRQSPPFFSSSHPWSDERAESPLKRLKRRNGEPSALAYANAPKSSRSVPTLVNFDNGGLWPSESMTGFSQYEQNPSMSPDPAQRFAPMGGSLNSSLPYPFHDPSFSPSIGGSLGPLPLGRLPSLGLGGPLPSIGGSSPFSSPVPLIAGSTWGDQAHSFNGMAPNNYSGDIMPNNYSGDLKSSSSSTDFDPGFFRAFGDNEVNRNRNLSVNDRPSYASGSCSSSHAGSSSNGGGSSGCRCQISNHEHGWSARMIRENDDTDEWESGGGAWANGDIVFGCDREPLYFGQVNVNAQRRDINEGFQRGTGYHSLGASNLQPRRKTKASHDHFASSSQRLLSRGMPPPPSLTLRGPHGSSPSLDSLLGAADHVGAFSGSPPTMIHSLSRIDANSSDSDDPNSPHFPASHVLEIADSDAEDVSGRRRGRGGKTQKGLRYYSLKVCEKVEQLKTTTYNKVADDLVRELTSHPDANVGGKVFDEKNIRRRVYDAINVLVAIGVLNKDRKDITWGGLPGGANPELRQQERQRDMLMVRNSKKRRRLDQLLTHLVSFKNLVARNQSANTLRLSAPCSSSSSPSFFTSASVANSNNSCSSGLPPRFLLPFVVIHSNAALMECNMTDDRSKVKFKFSDRFVVEEEQNVLKKLGLARVSTWELPALIPRELRHLYPRDFIDDTSHCMR